MYLHNFLQRKDPTKLGTLQKIECDDDDNPIMKITLGYIAALADQIEPCSGAITLNLVSELVSKRFIMIATVLDGSQSESLNIAVLDSKHIQSALIPFQ
jgi:hypothetical protein